MCFLKNRLFKFIGGTILIEEDQRRVALFDETVEVELKTNFCWSIDQLC